MRVLIVGSGGREHALAWAIRRSTQLEELFVAPGNGGTETVATNVAIDGGDVGGLVEFVRERDIDLTVVGPEAPLVGGLKDELGRVSRRCFGPDRAAAQLEGSKVFAKEFMARHNIPTARFATFDDADAARRYVEDFGSPVVVKADGLAQGKGVLVTSSRDEALAAVEETMIERKFGESGRRVVIEERLEGPEVSVHAVCGGGRAVLFPLSQDHKRALDGDQGPNTGGMGAYAPVPIVTDALLADIERSIIQPTLDGMAADGTPFSGILYAGLMMTPRGPKVLEYNVRFGDPETQVLLPLLESDLLTILDNAARETPPDRMAFLDGAAATVVMASAGYPGAYEKGRVIGGVEAVRGVSREVFQAGTRRDGDQLLTSGGRVLSVSAWGPELGGAIRDAYDGVNGIEFEGAHWRTDIGHRAL